MNKLLKQLHPYKIFFSEKENRWRTTIADNTKVSGRRTIARQNRIDLEKFLLEHYHVQLNIGQEKHEQSKTFKEVFQIVEKNRLQYIKTPEKLISAKNTALKNDSDYWRYFAGTEFENMPVDKISKKDVENICLENLKKYNMRKKAFLSLRGILKSVFDMAYSEYWIEDNIYHRIQFKKFNDMLIPETPTEKRVHTADEVSQFLNELHRRQKNRPKYSSYWALEMQILMGMRRGEVPPLRWNVDVTDSPYLFPADTPNGCITNNAVYLVYQGICQTLGIEIVKDEIKDPHSFRRNAITDVINATNGNVVLASALFGNTPEVAKDNYYTGANLAMAKDILEQRKLVAN